MIKTIGFIGLGTMGQGMARQLLKHGLNVRGLDADPLKTAALAADGAKACSSVAQVCDGADAVITMLPRDEHVRHVLIGEGGVRSCASPGTLVIEMSTIYPTSSLQIGAELVKAGFRMLDAPVGRTPTDARAGTLLILAGGEREDFEQAKAVFNAMGDKVLYLGPAGSGIRMKVINNYMTMVSMVLTGETLALARKAGIELSVAAEVLQNTVAGRGQINVNYPRKVLAGDISPDFSIELGRKDLSLALKLGDELSVPLFLGASAHQLFGTACEQGRAGQDCTAMMLAIEQLAGMSPSVSMLEDLQ